MPLRPANVHWFAIHCQETEETNDEEEEEEIDEYDPGASNACIAFHSSVVANSFFSLILLITFSSMSPSSPSLVHTIHTTGFHRRAWSLVLVSCTKRRSHMLKNLGSSRYLNPSLITQVRVCFLDTTPWHATSPRYMVVRSRTCRSCRVSATWRLYYSTITRGLRMSRPGRRCGIYCRSWSKFSRLRLRDRVTF
ncbi:hypothetical protein CPB85DRAFT_1301925, partial [Mucidula mucida]